nr:MAG TPA: hypothetical protein [Caudoviricetes sp.]
MQLPFVPAVKAQHTDEAHLPPRGLHEGCTLCLQKGTL